MLFLYACVQKKSIFHLCLFSLVMFFRFFLKDKSHACYDTRKNNPRKQLSSAYVERNGDFSTYSFLFFIISHVYDIFFI